MILMDLRRPSVVHSAARGRAAVVAAIEAPETLLPDKGLGRVLSQLDNRV